MRLEARETPHVDDLALDALRAGELSGDERAHVNECETCDERLAFMQALADELAVDAVAADVPPARDAAIRAAARAAARRGRRRRIAFVAPVVVAAAAVVLFVVLRSGPTSSTSPDQTGRSVAVAPLDVNGDGKVDILDAFALARTLDDGAKTRPTWDANGDSHVDRLDVDAIARLVVSLTPSLPEKL